MAKKACTHCGGSGQVRDTSRPVKDGNYVSYPQSKTCPVCGGLGTTGFDESRSQSARPGNSGCLFLALLIIAVTTILVAFV